MAASSKDDDDKKIKKEHRPHRLNPPPPLPPTVAVPPPSSLPPLARGRDELIIVDEGTIDDAPPRGRGHIICRASPPGVVSPARYHPNGFKRPRMPMNDKTAAALLMGGEEQVVYFFRRGGGWRNVFGVGEEVTLNFLPLYVAPRCQFCCR